MANKYFRVIKTAGPADGPLDREHEQKLENYRKYGWPETNAKTQKDLLDKYMPPEYPNGYQLGHEIEIHSQSTATYVFAHTVSIITVLCCSNEPHEEKEE